MSDCPHTYWIPAKCPNCKGQGKLSDPWHSNMYYQCAVCKGKKEGFEECDMCHLVTVATQETLK